MKKNYKLLASLKLQSLIQAAIKSILEEKQKLVKSAYFAKQSLFLNKIITQNI
ncbi:hypothetical protein TTHERM_00780450 (macronuclear) [Tetrahymena thermophila SB210]|uniref:Uncharacterized protein n=1 Tax=Tetrahymena thermophila (strain SB210) TaxID=312017 RepID=I7LXQ9_TETTS|nr:hypothetical protein TTHERM_00780450 [Tetrahymena thermophila SB210]EAS05956.1 hypothetical protein TTHERM_00780450 [Tetrahymena thermophila SB210]|eukprot:XP_001026201.1 hypothetical protein TTHERM_00780450 [Tetrahymena thermophila SB210]